MHEDIADDVNLVMQTVYSDTKGTQDSEPEVEEEIIHVHHFPDAIVIIKEPGKSPETNIPVVESTPNHVDKNPKSIFFAYFAVTAFIFLIFSSILFQFYVLSHPPTTSIVLMLNSQQISLNGTIHLGRVLPPITISQSATAPTTGHAHQDARAATGTVTFYNGLFTQQFIPQGTVYTGSDGVAIVTTQDTTIPPGNPTTGYGTATVTAQAQQSGRSGNIPAGDINITINNGLLVRNNPFHGGADERSYQVVTKADITNAEAPLKAALAQSVNGALSGQLKSNESLVTPSCSTTTTSDHQSGDEAAAVKITASETCTAAAVNTDALQAKVTDLLLHLAAKKLGSGYSLLENPQISVTSASSSKQVTISFTSKSTWVYALSSVEQRHIKKIIAGKTNQKAIQLLSSLPGIESVSLQSSGFADDTRLPKDIERIHFQLIIGI